MESKNRSKADPIEKFKKEHLKALEKELANIEALTEIDDFESFKVGVVKEFKGVIQHVNQIYSAILESVSLTIDHYRQETGKLASIIGENNALFTDCLKTMSDRIDKVAESHMFDHLSLMAIIRGEPLPAEMVSDIAETFQFNPDKTFMAFAMGMMTVAVHRNKVK